MTEVIAHQESELNHEMGSVEPQVLILDAGAQYGKLIDRRVRELGVKCDIAPLDAPTELLNRYRAFIISGGPASVTESDARAYNPDLFSLGKPILGDCYGHQLIAHHFGGKIGQHARREDGKTAITVNLQAALFKGLASPTQTVIMSHGDSVLEAPEGFEVTAMSGDIIAAMQNIELGIYTTQFHPEVTHTENGREMLARFLFDAAKLEKNYQVGNKLTEALEYVRAKAGKRDIVCFVSGGIDSSVTAALLVEADLPGHIRFVLVDHGMLRQGEVEQVVASYQKMGLTIDVLDEADRFYSATTKLRNGQMSKPLCEATDPQEIRQIIGNTFIAVRNRYFQDHLLDPEVAMLAMGTLRPDLIESGSAYASVNADEEGIKQHHNDTEDARRLRDNNLTIEPLSELHKDEVRELAKALNLPEEIVYRQPSPGPSGGVQIMSQTEAYRHPDIEEINAKLAEYRSSKLGVAVLLMATVGVQGDRRSYSHLVALSGNEKPDNWAELSALANEIPRKIRGVNRVVFASGEKVDGIIEGVTETHINHSGIDLWRKVDHVIRTVLVKYGLNRSDVISEVPIILTALSYETKGSRAVGIRPFITEDYMTGEAAIPGESFPLEAYYEIVEKVTAMRGINRLLYDLSDKPPGTTQWR